MGRESRGEGEGGRREGERISNILIDSGKGKGHDVSITQDNYLCRETDAQLDLKKMDLKMVAVVSIFRSSENHPADNNSRKDFIIGYGRGP